MYVDGITLPVGSEIKDTVLEANDRVLVLPGTVEDGKLIELTQQDGANEPGVYKGVAGVWVLQPDTLQERIIAAAATINVDLFGKADLTYVDTELALKADITYVDTGLAAKADTTTVNAAIALKANTTDVNTALATKANTTDVNTALAAKADTTYVNTELALKADASVVAAKANTTDVNTALATKANTTDVNTALALKADLTYVNTELALKADAADISGKADITYVDTGLAAKADITYVDAGLAAKANTADVTTSLNAKANTADVNTALAAKADTTTVNSALALKANTTDVNTALALKANLTYVDAELADKADAADVLALSVLASATNNGLMSLQHYTKLEGIEAEANNYTLPVATTSIMGGVKQGPGNTIAPDGTLTSLVQTVQGRTGAVVVTVSDLGLANVENKSSATIRSELTQSNVTTALGFTPENAANKNQASGYAGLGADGKISQSLLPAVALTNTYVVANEAAMLALTVQTGDVAVRQDITKSFILAGTDPTNLTHWQELLAPTSPVQSVNGMTGTVIITDITGNAGTATVLQTARTIALTGDVTGSVSFNGSQNVDIAATVQDDSHNHTFISNGTTNVTASASFVTIQIGGSTIGTLSATGLSLTGDLTVNDPSPLLIINKSAVNTNDAYLHITEDGTSVAIIGAPGAANDLINGSTKNDLCIRSNNQDLLFSTNNGTSISALLNTNGQFGIPINSAAPTDGSAYFYKSTTGAVVSGYQVQFETGSAGSRVVASTVTYDGDILVGTPTKSTILASGDNTTLEVKGSSANKVGIVKATSFGTTNDTTIELFASDTSDQVGLLTSGTTSITLNTDSLERVRVTANGAVGIGTDLPDSLLHVHGPAGTHLLVESTDNTDGSIRSKNTLGDYSFGVTGAATGHWYIHDNTNSHLIHTYVPGATGYHVFYTNHLERLRINNTGIGISNSDPQARLHIGDSTAAATNMIMLGKKTASLETVDPTISQHSLDGTSNDLALGAFSATGKILMYTGEAASGAYGATSNRLRVTINELGNILVGTTVNADSKIYVRGVDQSATSYAMTLADSLGIAIASFRNDRVVALYNKVGIGIAEPNSELHVVNPTATALSQVEIGGGAGYSAVRLNGNGTKKNWTLGTQYNINGGFEITPSSTNGGSTFIGEVPAFSIIDNGNVGIGVAAPVTALDVRRASIVQIRAYDTVGADIRIVADADNGSITVDNNFPLLFKTNSTEKARITTDGLFGIGLNNPQFALHTKTASAEVVGYFESGGANSFIRFGNTAATAGYIGYLNNGSMVLQTSATERVRIDGSGNVGIGVTNQSTALEVKTNTDSKFRLTSLTTVGDTGEGVALDSTNIAGGALVPLAVRASDIRFRTGSSERIRVDGLGRVGINVLPSESATSTRLLVKGMGITSDTNSAAILNGDGNVIAAFKDDLRVGIGTDAPAYKLDVNGLVNSQGYRTVTSGSPVGTFSADTNGVYIDVAGANVFNLYTNNIARMTVATTGYIGVNCTPGYQLDVRTSLTGTTGTSNTTLNLGSGADGRDVNIRFSDSVNVPAYIGYLSGAMYFNLNGAKRVEIDTAGKVGIGTNGPSQKLHVDAGSSNTVARFEASNITSQSAYINVDSSAAYFGNGGAGTHDFVTCNMTSHSVSVSTAGTTRLTVDSSGNMAHKQAIADQSYSLVTATEAGSATIPNNQSTYLLNSAGNATLSVFAVTMPAAPVSGQIVRISGSMTVDSFTVTPNSGQTVAGSYPITFTPNSPIAFIYESVNAIWFRI